MESKSNTIGDHLNVWKYYSKDEQKNIAFYIGGIMLYTFGLEAFNGSILLLALEVFSKFNREYAYTGLMLGLNQAAMCIGSIVISPLIRRFPTRTVLSCAILLFGILSGVLMIIDAGTGGKFPTIGPEKVVVGNTTVETGKIKSYPRVGQWNPWIIVPFYTLVGVFYGMVELIRRVIPRDIVGGDVFKLKRLDSVVHVCYEIMGTAGAIAGSTFVYYEGPNFAPIVTPFCFFLAAISWSFISVMNFKKINIENQNYLLQVVTGLKDFCLSVIQGFKIIFKSRKYIWLIGGYSVPLYTHRFLENGLNALFAREILLQSNLSQIMTGGSNFGELCGALFVLFFAGTIKTPIPWLRLDAIMLLIVWMLGYFPIINNDPTTTAWAIAAVWVPVSFGWAAGDVSLAAYIQSVLNSSDNEDESYSPLGAVMAFLYVFYIVLYAILSYSLGLAIDLYKSRAIANGQSVPNAIRGLLNYIGGTQYTIVCGVLLFSTLIPQGALALNPDLISKSKKLNEDKEIKMNSDPPKT